MATKSTTLSSLAPARGLCRRDPRWQLGLKTAIVERENLGGIA